MTGFSSGSIIVTARRREETLQDTPIAVTALSGDALESRLIVSTTDLDKVAPNLQFHSYGTLTGNNSAAQVFIRGIGQTDATPAVDPGVGVYIDDVYMGRSVGGAMDFRDIANVQVLRGPQGTLFGRNTIGGAVLLSTNAPGENAGNSVRVGVGDDNLRELFGAFDMPIGDAWSARFSVGSRQRDGYVTRAFDGRDLGDEDMATGQFGLRWEPSDSVSLTLRADYTNEDENGSPFVFQTMNEAATFVGAASQAAGCPDIIDPLPPPVLVGPTPDPRCGNDAQSLGPFNNGGTYLATSTLENRGTSLVVDWEMSDTLSFKSITADRTLDWTGTRDADNTPLLILHTNYNSKSEQQSHQRGGARGGQGADLERARERRSYSMPREADMGPTMRPGPSCRGSRTARAAGAAPRRAAASRSRARRGPRAGSRSWPRRGRTTARSPRPRRRAGRRARRRPRRSGRWRSAGSAASPFAPRREAAPRRRR